MSIFKLSSKATLEVFPEQSTLLFEKQFSKKIKRVTYESEIWLKAEKYFRDVVEARRDRYGKLNIELDPERSLISSVFDKNNVRYTGIHKVNKLNSEIEPLSGVNLTDEEWDNLVVKFPEVKDLLSGKTKIRGIKRSVCFKGTNNDVKVYGWKWFLLGKELSSSKMDHFSESDARREGIMKKPVVGQDYPEVDGVDQPEMVIECRLQTPPRVTEHMKVAYLYLLDREISKQMRSRCEACKVNSPAQGDHAEPGYCLDMSLDNFTYFYDEVQKTLKLQDLVDLFTKSRNFIGAKTFYSVDLACAANSYLSDDYLINTLRNGFVQTSERALINVLKQVDENAVEC